MNSRALYKAVHGRMPARKAPRRRSALHQVGSARSWQYRGWVRSLPCAVCGATDRVEAAHTGSDGGMRLKASDYSCIPLCTCCHTFGADSYHVLGRERFEGRHGLAIGELVRELNHAWFAHAAEIK